jgi:chromosome partitioning protein
MPVIVMSSPKGGAGKTTAATILATELAQRDVSVTIIDGDPNRNVVDWAKLGSVPPALTVIGDVTEETIVDQIEAASSTSAFVVIDLEGTANLMVSYAISMADFVLIPVQGSQMDAKQAARQIRLIRDQERVTRRKIQFAVVFTRTSPAVTPKTLRHIADRMKEMGVPVLRSQLYDREAFRALFSYGGTLEGLRSKGVSNLDTALNNARTFTAEVIEHLRAGATVGEAA